MTEQQCRQLVRERSHGVCEICLQARATDMSHRRARSQGGHWTPANILHACRPCHHWLETHPVSGHDHGWRLWTGDDPLTTPVAVGRGRMLLTDTGQRTPTLHLVGAPMNGAHA